MIRHPPRPHVRIKRGRVVALVGAAMFCLIQGLAYFWAAAGELPPSLRAISLDGRIMWLWASVWWLAGLLCMADIYLRTLRHGISLFAGISMTWGLAHLTGWAVTVAATGIITYEWSQGLAYCALAAIIYGMLYKITALHDMVAQAAQVPARREGPHG